MSGWRSSVTCVVGRHRWPSRSCVRIAAVAGLSASSSDRIEVEMEVKRARKEAWACRRKRAANVDELGGGTGGTDVGELGPVLVDVEIDGEDPWPSRRRRRTPIA